MGGKTVSITDVARLARVSPATVSNVLTGRKSVSAKLVKKVQTAVKALDYRTDPLASMLRSGDAKIVAIVVPDLDNPFFTSIVSATRTFAWSETTIRSSSPVPVATTPSNGRD